MLLLLLSLGSPCTARAQAAERARTVLLTVAAPRAEAEQLAAVAKELLQRLHVEVELRHVARLDMRDIRQPLTLDRAFFARVWIALERSGRTRLYLEHSARDRVLVRDVQVDRQNSELVREQLGHILQSTIEGLLAGEEIGAPRSEALQELQDRQPEAAKAEPAKPKPHGGAMPSPVPWRLGLRYEALLLASAPESMDGPGAVLGVTFPTRTRRFGLELELLYRRPLRIEAEPVGARLQALALRTLGTYELVRLQHSRVRLGLGGGVDFVQVSPLLSRDQHRNVALAQSAWLSVAMGRATLCYAHDLSSWLTAELRLGLDLDFSGTRYVFERRGSGQRGEQSVLEPWPLRPLLSLGVSVP